MDLIAVGDLVCLSQGVLRSARKHPLQAPEQPMTVEQFVLRSRWETITGTKARVIRKEWPRFQSSVAEWEEWRKNSRALCSWHDKSGRRRDYQFPIETLRLVRKKP
jgi:hypothetical protein